MCVSLEVWMLDVGCRRWEVADGRVAGVAAAGAVWSDGRDGRAGGSDSQ
jgi:hypothetical protein